MVDLEAQISDLITRATNGEPSRLIGEKILSEYAGKISSLTELNFWATSGRIEAIVATYANDPDRNNAFITLVAVSPQHRKKGLAKSLITATLASLSARGFKRCSLEVRSCNVEAVKLYYSIGFQNSGPSTDILRMSFDLST